MIATFGAAFESGFSSQINPSCSRKGFFFDIYVIGLLILDETAPLRFGR
jgi:hypothetical protein